VNFYRAQDQARKQTRWLVCLFLLAVIFLIVITNLCVAVFVWYSDSSVYFQSSPLGAGSDPTVLEMLLGIVAGLGWQKFLWITLLVCGLVLMAIGFKWQSLRGGGRVIAESLGGRPLNPNSDDADDRRLLNVVEEMALASGVPVPPVYLLENESGINAFAAGYEIEDAVIGVTRGTVKSLNREQLQGVIAHEFSHILNGDMQLNLKIVAILHGILIIGEAGRFFVDINTRRSYRRSSRDKNGLAAGLLLFGFSLMVIGWLGQFFGAMIRSGVSRQREYLADASAVQFTRNPEGIGGALRTIGGVSAQSRIAHRGAHELGHFFFSSAYANFLSLFATHPPLSDRIQRIMPSWDGSFLQPQPKSPVRQARSRRAPLNAERAGEFMADAKFAANPELTGSAALASNGVLADSDHKTQTPDAVFRNVKDDAGMSNEFLDGLYRQAREPHGAVALVLALLFDSDKNIRATQQTHLIRVGASWLSLTRQTYRKLAKFDSRQRLELIELAIPALKVLSVPQYQKLRELMTLLVNADGSVDLFEWVLYQLVRRYCDRYFGLARIEKPKYKTIQSVATSYQTVLSRLVYYGDESGCDDEAKKTLAFNRGCAAAGLDTIELLPKEKCTLSAFVQAVHALSRAYPLVKPRMIKGLISTAQTDSHINIKERYIITAMAAVMDCPLIGLDLD